MSVNKVILVGRLGVDPESRAFPQGGSICNLRIATSETWRDKETGERKERTEWHRVILRNKLGEIAQKYLKKGSQVYVEGRIQTRKWQDQSGKDQYTTEIVGSEMTMLDSKSADSSATTPHPPAGGQGNVDYNPGDYYGDDDKDFYG